MGSDGGLKGSESTVGAASEPSSSRTRAMSSEQAPPLSLCVAQQVEHGCMSAACSHAAAVASSEPTVYPFAEACWLFFLAHPTMRARMSINAAHAMAASARIGALFIGPLCCTLPSPLAASEARVWLESVVASRSCACQDSFHPQLQGGCLGRAIRLIPSCRLDMRPSILRRCSSHCTNARE